MPEEDPRRCRHGEVNGINIKRMVPDNPHKLQNIRLLQQEWAMDEKCTPYQTYYKKESWHLILHIVVRLSVTRFYPMGHVDLREEKFQGYEQRSENQERSCWTEGLEILGIQDHFSEQISYRKENIIEKDIEHEKVATHIIIPEVACYAV